MISLRILPRSFIRLPVPAIFRLNVRCCHAIHTSIKPCPVRSFPSQGPSIPVRTTTATGPSLLPDYQSVLSSSVLPPGYNISKCLPNSLHPPHLSHQSDKIDAMWVCANRTTTNWDIYETASFRLDLETLSGSFATAVRAFRYSSNGCSLEAICRFCWTRPPNQALPFNGWCFIVFCLI